MEQFFNSNQSQNKVDSTPKPSNLESKIESLSSLVSDLASSQKAVYQEFNNFKGAITSKLDSQTTLKPEPIEAEAEMDWWSDFDPDSKKVVQAEVNHKVSKLKEEFNKTLEEREAQLEQKRQEEARVASIRQKYDGMASKEFPQLGDESHPLRQEFNKVWAEEMSLDEKYASKPTAVYDTVRIAYANLVNRGELVPESFKSEARRLISVHDGLLPKFKGSTPERPEELNKQQLFMAKKLGVSPEAYIKRLRTNYSNRDMS